MRHTHISESRDHSPYLTVGRNATLFKCVQPDKFVRGICVIYRPSFCRPVFHPPRTGFFKPLCHLLFCYNILQMHCQAAACCEIVWDCLRQAWPQGTGLPRHEFTYPLASSSPPSWRYPCTARRRKPQGTLISFEVGPQDLKHGPAATWGPTQVAPRPHYQLTRNLIKNPMLSSALLLSTSRRA